MYELDGKGCSYPGNGTHPYYKRWKGKEPQIQAAFAAMGKIDEAFKELSKLGLSVEWAPAGLAIAKGSLEGDPDEQYGNLVGTISFPY